jgi:protein-disulfide isomerase
VVPVPQENEVGKLNQAAGLRGAGFVLAVTGWLTVANAPPKLRAANGARQPTVFGAAPASTTPTRSIDTERIVRYLRERFGLPANVKLAVGPLKDSALRGFDEGNVSANDGHENKQQPILVSRDGRYLIVGKIQPLQGEAKGAIAQHLRQAFKIPPATALSVGGFRKSAYPGLYATTVTATSSQGKQVQDFYVSRDEHSLVMGAIYNLTVDPRREAQRTIVTANRPSAGAATAKVTVVEYADLQCPTCAALHQFIEKQLLPRYPEKVRVVFKEFPLAGHNWSLTAAIANECAYRLEPSAFLKYRTSIFVHQNQITPANVREQMLTLGAQAGIDRSKLAACIDAKVSLPQIEADRREAQKLGVDRTPTSFINGRLVIGTPPAAEFNQMVDDALAGK